MEKIAFIKRKLEPLEYLIAIALFVGLVLIGTGIEMKYFGEHRYNSSTGTYYSDDVYIIGNVIGMMGNMLLVAAMLVGGFVDKNIEIPIRIAMLIVGCIGLFFMSAWAF